MERLIEQGNQKRTEGAEGGVKARGGSEKGSRVGIENSKEKGDDLAYWVLVFQMRGRKPKCPEQEARRNN